MKHWLRRCALAMGLALPCVVLPWQPRALAAQESPIAQEAEGIRVDFQDAELAFVITALAEAAGINVTWSNLPARRITLRLRQPVPLSAVPALIRNLAVSNGLRAVQEGTLLRLELATADGNAGVEADSSAADVRLYVHRLRHVRAAQLASTLQAIFGSGPGAAARPAGLSVRPLSERLRAESIAPMGEGGAPAPAAVPAATPSQPMINAQLTAEVQIVPDEATNALLVRAVPADWATLRAAIDAMDLRPLQVVIEVIIAELRTNDDTEVGVSARVSGGSPNQQTGELKSSVAGDFILTMRQRGPTFSADVGLAALASRGNVRILSRPILLAQNNQEARILVGEQRPFVQVFRSLPTDNSVRDQVVQYRDVATTLTIRPTINPDGYVNLQVLQEVSNATDATQFGAPIISTREAATHLFVRDGQTAIVGGLVSRQTDRVRTGIPWLSSIPLLGGLFGSTTVQNITSELFVFLTPHVVTDDADVDRLRDGLQRDTTGTEPGSAVVRPRRP